MRLWIGTYPSRDGVVPAAEGVWRVDLLDDGTLVDRGRAAPLLSRPLPSDQMATLYRKGRVPVRFTSEM